MYDNETGQVYDPLMTLSLSASYCVEFLMRNIIDSSLVLAS